MAVLENTLRHSPSLGHSHSQARTSKVHSPTPATPAVCPRALGPGSRCWIRLVIEATWCRWDSGGGRLQSYAPCLGLFSESCFLFRKKTEFATE